MTEADPRNKFRIVARNDNLTPITDRHNISRLVTIDRMIAFNTAIENQKERAIAFDKSLTPDQQKRFAPLFASDGIHLDPLLREYLALEQAFPPRETT